MTYINKQERDLEINIKTTANIGEFYKEVIKSKSEFKIEDFENIISTKWISAKTFCKLYEAYKVSDTSKINDEHKTEFLGKIEKLWKRCRKI